MGINRKQTPLLTKEQVTEQLLQQHLRCWKSNPKYIVENLYVFDWESDMLLKPEAEIGMKWNARFHLLISRMISSGSGESMTY